MKTFHPLPTTLYDEPHSNEKLSRVLSCSAPALVVQCTPCGDNMELEGLHFCRGGGDEGRILALVRCRSCSASGEVRFSAAPRPRSGSVMAFDGNGVTIEAGGATFLTATCHCGVAGQQVLLRGNGGSGHVAWFECELAVCGHPFALSIRKGTQFDIHEHLHTSQAAGRRQRRG